MPAIHCVQFDIAWEDKDANFERVRAMLGLADNRPLAERGDLVILPEMFDTGFSLNTERTADKDGVTEEFVRDLARSLGAYVQGGRTIIGPDGKGRNMAVVSDPDGEIICQYAKIHPFSFGREPERFSGGESIETYAWKRDGEETVVCPSVCYDLRFPELYRIGLLRGAEVFTLGANWPAARASHWRALIIARAVENQAVVVGVNRTGSDPHLAYAGGTIAAGPTGEILGELADEEGVLSVRFDLGELRKWREKFPAWKDIRLIKDD